MLDTDFIDVSADINACSSAEGMVDIGFAAMTEICYLLHRYFRLVVLINVFNGMRNNNILQRFTGKSGDASAHMRGLEIDIGLAEIFGQKKHLRDEPFKLYGSGQYMPVKHLYRLFLQ